MKTYEFSFDWSYINPIIIVVAKTREQAEIYAKEAVAAEGIYDPNTVEFEIEKPIEEGTIIYYNNGEY